MALQPYSFVDEVQARYEARPSSASSNELEVLRDIEAFLSVIERLLETIYKISADAELSERKSSAICVIAGQLIYETRRVRRSLTELI